MSTLNDYVSMAWVFRTEQLGPGDWRLTVDGLDDFEVTGESEAELFEHYPAMLRSHLNAYLQLGKPVPGPARSASTTDASQNTGYATETWVVNAFNWNVMGEAIGLAKFA